MIPFCFFLPTNAKVKDCRSCARSRILGSARDTGFLGGRTGEKSGAGVEGLWVGDLKVSTVADTFYLVLIVSLCSYRVSFPVKDAFTYAPFMV